MFLSFKITLTTTASKTSELVDLTYQEPIWRCPEWPETCWCWNPRSVCPGSTADLLAHWQTQDKHRNTPPGVCQKTQYAEGRRKKAQDRSTDPLGGSCVSVFNGRDEAEDYIFIFKFPILPSCQVDQVYLADNFWRQVILQGCLKSRNTKKKQDRQWWESAKSRLRINRVVSDGGCSEVSERWPVCTGWWRWREICCWRRGCGSPPWCGWRCLPPEDRWPACSLWQHAETDLTRERGKQHNERRSLM